MTGSLPWLTGWPGLRLPAWRRLARRARGRRADGLALARFGGRQDEAEWVTVFWAAGYEQAHVVRGALEAEGIPAIMRAESAVYGTSALVGVRLLVPAALEDRARQVLAGP